MVDMGLSFTQIGIYITMLGAVAALLGALIAGWMLKHISRSTALMTFSILKIMSLGSYAYLAYAYEQKIKINAWLIYAVNALEDAFAAMLLVVMLTLVMHYSRKTMRVPILLFRFQSWRQSVVVFIALVESLQMRLVISII